MSTDDVAYMQNEIDIMKQVDHPNIVRMTDVYEDSAHYCMIMELMQGGEVSSKISH
jgi:serine/threonine protein kinase